MGIVHKRVYSTLVILKQRGVSCFGLWGRFVPTATCILQYFLDGRMLPARLESGRVLALYFSTAHFRSKKNVLSHALSQTRCLPTRFSSTVVVSSWSPAHNRQPPCKHARSSEPNLQEASIFLVVGFRLWLLDETRAGRPVR